MFRPKPPGKASITAAALDFAGTLWLLLVSLVGSDSVLKESNYAAAPDLQMYPATAAAVVPVVNIDALDAIGEQVIVDRTTLAAVSVDFDSQILSFVAKSI